MKRFPIALVRASVHYTIFQGSISTQLEFDQRLTARLCDLRTLSPPGLRINISFLIPLGAMISKVAGDESEFDLFRYSIS